jgi:hypothetical protein
MILVSAVTAKEQKKDPSFAVIFDLNKTILLILNVWKQWIGEVVSLLKRAPSNEPFLNKAHQLQQLIQLHLDYWDQVLQKFSEKVVPEPPATGKLSF